MPLTWRLVKTEPTVDEVNRFYSAQDSGDGTHLALRWKGRIQYTVPRQAAGQRACWKVFQPGKLELPLRAMTLLPHLSGAVNCAESEDLKSIREGIGIETGLSCCRAGAEGVWTKDTILFLSQKTVEPQYVVKAGAVGAVDALLRNEAQWLHDLRGQASLTGRIPELVAYRSGKEFCFVAQSTLSGECDFRLGEPQFSFLRSLHAFSRQSMRYRDSRLYRTLNSRIEGLTGLLPEAWLRRLEGGMRRVEQSLPRTPILLVAAHNDFTPWNIRLEQDVAKVFDWEYADYEQLPLFDPLHFVLAPMALRSEPPAKIIRNMQQTVQLCQKSLGEELCYDAETQALAYMINLCTLYLWADRGKRNTHPSLVSYARVIDSAIYSQRG
jgi:hypothetical protein